MTHTLLVRCAPLAIAASAVLPIIPALAQDATVAEPVFVLPPVEAAPAAPTAAPVPTIVLPSTTPVVEAPQATVAAPTETRAAQRPAAAAPVRPTRTIEPRRAAPAAVDAAPIASQAVAAPANAAQAMPVTPPVENTAAESAIAPVTTTEVESTNEAMIAGILGALGLAAVGGVAFAASRRRRRRVEDFDEAAYDRIEEPMVEPVPVRQPVAVRNSEPAFTTPVVPTSSFAYAAPASVMTQTAPPRAAAPQVNGDPVALPAEMPETFEERDALLKTLVAAEPDRANPFTGVRARARRAKLIMQSLNRDFTSRKPRIDLSEYTNRWPALRGWQPATA